MVIAVGYAILHGRLNVHHVDDAWSTSFAWQYFRNGITQDVIFRAPGTMPLVFGKTHAVVFGVLLEPLGWTRSHVHYLSTACIFGSALCWTAIGRGVGLGREAAVLFGASLLMLQPMMLAANVGRPDALTLLLASACLLALLRRLWLAAGLLAVLGFENHPMGAIAFAWGAAYLLHERRTLFPDAASVARQGTRLGLGLALGAAWALWSNRASLSWSHLQLLAASAQQFGTEHRSSWTFLHHYFRDRGHVELAFFVVALVILALRRDTLALTLFAATILAAIVVRRQSGFYVLFAFPVFALLCARAFERPWLRRAVFSWLVVAFAWRCHATWQQHGSVHAERTFAEVVAAVPRDGLPVVGLNDFWFAFKDEPRRFVPADYHSDFKAAGLTAFYFVDSDIAPNGFDRLRPAIAAYGPGHEIARIPDSATTHVRIVRLP